MSQLYVNEPSAKVGVEDGRFTVLYKNGMEKSIPIESLEGICLFGSVQISSQCLRECLTQGIDVQFYSAFGSYFGKLSSTRHVNTARQRLQAKLYDDGVFRLELGKRIIRAKIHNQITVLRRYARSSDVDIGDEIIAMQNAVKKTANCKTLDELMGYEGSAARVYYKTLSALTEPDFAFEGRSRRPPLDPFNSMLSLGYTVLLYAVYGALESRGLNPYFGFMHSDREKHPALASDMMEEWRAVIVDSVVMGMVNGHEIKQENFFTLPEKPGIFLNKDGFKAFMTKLEKRFAFEQSYLSYANYRVSFRRAVNLQAGELVKAIEAGNAELYEPIVIR